MKFLLLSIDSLRIEMITKLPKTEHSYVCNVVAPITTVAITSLFTGLYPHNHGIRNLIFGNKIRDNVKMLAEILHEQGYKTYAWLSIEPLRKSNNPFLSRAFDRYDDNYPGFKRDVSESLKFIENIPDSENMFLWIHYADLHQPIGGTTAISPEPASIQEAFIRYDNQFDRINSAINTVMNKYKDAKIIITGDHGERVAPGSPYLMGHGERLCNEEIFTPLCFYNFSTLKPKKFTVRQIDVMPTILRELNIPIPPVDGVPIQDQTEALSAYSESFLRPFRMRYGLQCLQKGEQKIVTMSGNTIEWSGVGNKEKVESKLKEFPLV